MWVVQVTPTPEIKNLNSNYLTYRFEINSDLNLIHAETCGLSK